jgi:leucyl aminopeptidase
MKAFLTKFSSFRTRYYRSDTGKQSQQWLLSQIKEVSVSILWVTLTLPVDCVFSPRNDG